MCKKLEEFHEQLRLIRQKLEEFAEIKTDEYVEKRREELKIDHYKMEDVFTRWKEMIERFKLELCDFKTKLAMNMDYDEID